MFFRLESIAPPDFLDSPFDEISNFVLSVGLVPLSKLTSAIFLLGSLERSILVNEGIY